MPSLSLSRTSRSANCLLVCLLALSANRLLAQYDAPGVPIADLPAGLVWSPLVWRPDNTIAAVLHAPDPDGGLAYLIRGDSAYLLPADSSYRRVLPHNGKLVLAPTTQLDLPPGHEPLPVAYAVVNSSDTIFLTDGTDPGRTAFINSSPSLLGTKITNLDRVNACTTSAAKSASSRHLASRALAARNDTLAAIGRFYGTSLNRTQGNSAQSHFIATATIGPDGSVKPRAYTFTELSDSAFAVQPFGKRSFALVSPREVVRFNIQGQELDLIALPNNQRIAAAAPATNVDQGMWLLIQPKSGSSQLAYLTADGGITTRYIPTQPDQTWRQLLLSPGGSLTVAGSGGDGYFTLALSPNLDADPRLTKLAEAGAWQPSAYGYPLPDTATTAAPFAILDAFPECGAQDFGAIGFTASGEIFVEYPHHRELRTTNGQYLGKGPATVAAAKAPTPLADGIEFRRNVDTVVARKGSTDVGRFRPVSTPRNAYALSQLFERPDGGALAVYISTPPREPPLTELLLVNTAGELEGRAYLGQVDTVIVSTHGLLAYGAIAARGPFPARSSLSFIPWSTLGRPAALPYVVEVCTLPHTVTFTNKEGQPEDFLLTRERPYVNNGAVTFTVILAEQAELSENLDTILVDPTCAAPARGSGRIEVVLRDTTLGHRVDIESLGAGLRQNTANPEAYTVRLIDDQGCRIERRVTVGTSAPIRAELYTERRTSGWDVSADIPAEDKRAFSYRWSNGARGGSASTYRDSGRHLLTLAELRYDGTLGCSQDFAFTLGGRAVSVQDAASFGASLNLGTNGQLSVELATAHPQAELNLLDLFGRRVYTRRVVAGATRLTRPTDLAPGTYVAQLHTGSQRVSRLIVW